MSLNYDINGVYKAVEESLEDPEIREQPIRVIAEGMKERDSKLEDVTTGHLMVIVLECEQRRKQKEAEDE